MGDSGKTFHDLVGLFRSWIPWHSEPKHVSRDFRMPDQSCRVCYKIDSQFTLFDRRHHCRFCGRIFCAKCTSNRVPAVPREPETSQVDWDRIRVCNYCFEQWEQDLTVVLNNGTQVACLDICTTSASATSFLSTRSTVAFESSSTTFFHTWPPSINNDGTFSGEVKCWSSNKH